ncbi:uncharacterized protein B0H18DRAFT_221902 [Fomitopsis serialis]|uniref:uncharacterized protein n=1 Tax=Fomitopsis serialis TaxID=139415 RepID=UPI0020084A4C|nr:uncharacterized protein B0H18DRAFT_221902 [Neoantrodia serialis]KAH9929205.1 hypothetical protein B0H18DRAFT_221902 [Neoantrodia serialis]
MAYSQTPTSRPMSPTRHTMSYSDWLNGILHQKNPHHTRSRRPHSLTISHSTSLCLLSTMDASSIRRDSRRSFLIMSGPLSWITVVLSHHRRLAWHSRRSICISFPSYKPVCSSWMVAWRVRRTAMRIIMMKLGRRPLDPPSPHLLIPQQSTPPCQRLRNPRLGRLTYASVISTDAPEMLGKEPTTTRAWCASGLTATRTDRC